MDFIALAARPLALGIPGNDGPHAVNFILNHYSIEYWESTCPAGEGVEYFSEDFRNTHNAERIDSFQLMRDERDWIVWRRNLVIYGPQWSFKHVGVSIIQYNNSTANRFAAFFEPEQDNEMQVQDMWAFLVGRAEQYPFAEQTGANGIFRGNFQHWPNSQYFMPWEPPGNNSNSFGRWIVRESGRDIPDLFGVFPGRQFPVDVRNNGGWSAPELNNP